MSNLIEFEVTCYCCGKRFFVKEDEKHFPSKEKYFCSRSCANTRKQTKDIREKISAGLSKFHKTQNKNKNAEKQKQYICGSEELDNKYVEISLQHGII